MTEYNYKIICGSPIRGEHLKLARAKAIYKAAMGHPYVKDIQCNVYDMASNVYEWTTETSIDSDSPCVGRGGAYDYSYNYTSSRNNGSASDSYGNVGFRPLLFVGLNS